MWLILTSYNYLVMFSLTWINYSKINWKWLVKFSNIIDKSGKMQEQGGISSILLISYFKGGLKMTKLAGGELIILVSCNFRCSTFTSISFSTFTSF
jgi:hypothetical protein